MTAWRPAVRTAAERLLGAAPARAPRGGRLVLAYHNVVPDGVAVAGDASLHLPVGALGAQLALLRREAEVVSLAELLEAPPSRGARLVAVTFDDAYASAVGVGLPCCAAEAVPVTVFVAPGLLGTIPAWDRRAAAGQWSAADRTAFLWEAQGLAPDAPSSPHPARMSEPLERCRIATEAALLAAAAGGVPGVTLGNHTWRHPNLGALDAAAVREEVAATAAWLAARAPAAALPVLAYPYGVPPRDPAGALRDSGVTHALAVAGGWMRAGDPRGPWTLPRWNVPAGISAAGFRLRLRGWLAGGAA